MSPHESGVAAFDAALGERAGQPPVRYFRLRHDHQTRGVAIETMHDAGTSVAPAREPRPARRQCVDQCVVPVPGSRVDDESSRLADYQEMIVFEHDVEGHRVRLDFSPRFVRGKVNGDAVLSHETPPRSTGSPVHRDGASANQPGGLGA